jgi:hypothetical protein
VEALPQPLPRPRLPPIDSRQPITRQPLAYTLYLAILLPLPPPYTPLLERHVSMLPIAAAYFTPRSLLPLRPLGGGRWTSFEALLTLNRPSLDSRSTLV